MSRAHKIPPRPVPEVFPNDFFSALSAGDEESALACLQVEAFPDSEPPSPRAQALIDSGEFRSYLLLLWNEIRVLVKSNLPVGSD
jgi:hypothetical protein